MKKVVMILGIAALLASCGESYKSASVKTDVDSASYGIGYLIGTDLARGGAADSLTQDLILSGLVDGLKGDSSASKLTRDEAEKAWMAFMQKQKVAMMAKQQEELKKTKEDGAKFLEENKAKAGVITTESGLQYTIEKQGTGATAKEGDMLKVHYTGKLVDGTEFDSSAKSDKPFEFQVGKGRVIKGWDEALQMMPTGSKWKLFIPSELGYGDREVGSIPAGSVLVFDVELLEINPKKKK